jgi:hypothetical protein
MQRLRGPVGQDRHPCPAVPPRLLELNCDAHKGFLALGSPTAQSWLLTADVGLIDLYRAGQPSSTAGALKSKTSTVNGSSFGCTTYKTGTSSPLLSRRARMRPRSQMHARSSP